MQIIYFKKYFVHNSLSPQTIPLPVTKETKSDSSQKHSEINENLPVYEVFGRSTSGFSLSAGAVCVLGMVSALFSRSVILVSFAPLGLALLQEVNTKM